MADDVNTYQAMAVQAGDDAWLISFGGEGIAVAECFEEIEPVVTERNRGSRG